MHIFSVRYLVYSCLRRHIPLVAIVFLVNSDIDNWTSNEQRRSCLSLLRTLNQTMGRLHPRLNLFDIPCKYTERERKR